MLNKVEKTILKHGMLQPYDRVIVAVSGGSDSVALLSIMQSLAERFKTTIFMAYLNHGLRGEESAKEETFVRQLSERFSVPIICKFVDIASVHKKRGRGRSIEEIGRQERYQFLYDAAKIHDAQKIALGHHFNDQCETVMMNLIRGSGVDGLKGILPIRDGKIIRPLMDCTKEEILLYLNHTGLQFVYDLSNAEDVYYRNKIRNHLIPEIKRKYNPAFEKKLHQMADIMRIDNDFFSINVKKAMSEMQLDKTAREYIIKIPEFLSYHEAIQRRVIKDVFLSFSSEPKGISYPHIKAFMDLINGNNKEAALNLPFGIEVERYKDTVSVHYKPRKIQYHNRHTDVTGVHFQYDHIQIPSKINIVECGINMIFSFVDAFILEKIDFIEKNTAYIDFYRTAPPFTLRSPRPGDKINPLGMKGTQKLKSLFINRKVPKHMRYKIPVLADTKSIIWVAGIRLSEHVKITGDTRRIMKVEIV